MGVWFRPGDEPALADICLKTADAGADATGIFADDALLSDLLSAVGPDQAVVLISHMTVPEQLIDRVVRLEAGQLVS